MIESRKVEPTAFASMIATRTFFPAKYIAQAREELSDVLKKTGNRLLDFPAGETKTGAIETTQDGEKYARWFDEHRKEIGGVILTMPNFGDERGAVAALRDANVPIYIQTQPDEIGKMSPADRRDGFCGRVSITDNFWKYGIKFTVLEPHVLALKDSRFQSRIKYFDTVCRVANGMERFRVGAIGGRTSAFKTVRIDEDALEKAGISMETYDLLDVYMRMKAIKGDDKALKEKTDFLQDYATWCEASKKALPNIARLGVILDQIIEENGLDAIALRCWDEFQKYEELNFSPCVLLSDYNNRGVPAACEVDVGNAIAMHALRLASKNAAACLDWNNNYREDANKTILFHCGPVPQEMMTEKGWIQEHSIIKNAIGRDGCGYGCNQGSIKPGDMVFASSRTADGKLQFYIGTGKFTEDPIEKEFFGCAGVAEIPELQKVLLHVCEEGHRHHTSATHITEDTKTFVFKSAVANAIYEALTKYNGFDVRRPQLEERKQF